MQLNQALQKMLTGDSQACKQVAKYCHNSARAYLRYKLSNSDERLLQRYLKRENIAWDCIASLFERNEQGQYVIFDDFFDSSELHQLDESETKMMLRRLVFSKVNDGIFRNFGAFDPSLRKIIRNIKRAVKDMDELAVENKSEQKVVRFTSTEREEGPAMPPELLEIRLFHRLEDKIQMPDIMRELSELLQQQQMYRPSVDISQLALCIRKVYARMNDFLDAEQNARGQPVFYDDEIESQIQKAVDNQKEQLASTYLASGKLEEDRFETYFKAVSDILIDEYVQNNPKADTYFEHLKTYMTDLEKEIYREQHRQYLEYMVQKTREELVESLREDFQYSAGDQI